MATIDPIAIDGRWRQGFALDYQIVSSEFIGYNEFGHPIFDTKRTELGELLYRLKYRSDEAVCDEIMETVAGFMQSWNPPVTMIVPMPATQARKKQPVQILANLLAERLGLQVSLDAVTKVKKTPQLKNVYDYRERCRLLMGAFSAAPSIVSGQRILLFDDLYQSGATMDSVTNALYQQGQAAEVYVLALTRSKK